MPSVNIQPALLLPDTSNVLFPNLPQHSWRKRRERIMVAHFSEGSLYAAQVARLLKEPAVNERFDKIHERSASCPYLATPWRRRPLVRILLLKIVYQCRNLRWSTLDLDVQPLGRGDLSLCHIQVFITTLLKNT